MIDLGEGVAIVGAGPVGLVSALLLAQRGHDVHLFESRADPRKVGSPRGRSISLTLTTRGWAAIRRAGAEERIRQIAIPLRGRLIHLETGEMRYQAYGTHGEAIDSVSRSALTTSLLDAVAGEPRINLHFGWKCTKAIPEAGLLTFDCSEGASTEVRASRMLAADGATSAVRSALLDRSDFEVSQSYSRYFYKELNIPSSGEGKWPLDPNALHLWPRGDCMLAAFANPVQGLTCTLLLPIEGERSFNALAHSKDLKAFFQSTFSDLVALMPGLISDFYVGAPSHVVSIRCYPWVFGGLALIGDAAHAMFPFLGQGLNAGLEDTSVLLDSLTRAEHDWDRALVDYQRLRKPNCDAITDIAADHYRELAQATRDPLFVLRKRLETRLGELFPQELQSAYHVVSFSDRPYLEALRTAALQNRIVDRLLTLENIDEGLESGAHDAELKSFAREVLASPED